MSDVQMKNKKLSSYEANFMLLIGLGFHFQNIQIITAEKRTVKPENAFGDTALGNVKL